jgi:hypothetical protein
MASSTFSVADSARPPADNADNVSHHSVELKGYLNNDEEELAHYDTLPLRYANAAPPGRM